jgi:hypothetical protein
LWGFDRVEPNGATLDATGANPAVLGTETANFSYTPQPVEGKIGQALNFNGNAYAYVSASPSLAVPGNITIDAWVKALQFKNVTYNNIVIGSVSTTSKYPTRIFGLAINGVAPSNGSFPALGALVGYVTTDVAGFNEIVTSQPVFSLNKWIHVVFTRSIETGMHLYVNGVEQTVTVTSGTQNPVGTIERVTGLYIGHDSICTIDNICILNVALKATGKPLWQSWWFWIAIAVVFAVLTVSVYYFRKKGTISSASRTSLDSWAFE